MATFVLVHGAMHGGWCWRDVREQLIDHGHAVHTPTLTGQGDRRHLLTPDVGIEAHIADIVDLMWFEELSAVHLVLHSYAGVLAGPIAERVQGRLASIVYLGAFTTRPGECLLDVEPPETADRYRALAAELGDGWRLPTSNDFLEQWGIIDPAVVAWVAPRLTDFPLRCSTEPTRYDPTVLTKVRQVYLRHTGPPLLSLDGSYERARAAGHELHDLPCGHDTMIVAPRLTTELLERVAARSARR